MADLWTGDAGYLKAAVGWHDLLERIAMQPHGVPVSDEWYGPTGAFRGSETCDVAGYVRISMFPVTAEAEIQTSAIRKILFLGNSITRHGPNEEIGWSGDWGMAASAKERDYVHLVADALAKHTGHVPEIKVENIADFERNFATYDVDHEMKELFAFDPDLVILAIGENVPGLSSTEARAQFQAGVRKILTGVLAQRRPIVVVRSCFWADAAKDQVLREVCREVDGIFVDAGPLGEDSANVAHSERPIAHAGVAGHPGDRGMRAIADLIVEAVLAR